MKELTQGQVISAIKTLHSVGAITPAGQINTGRALMAAVNDPARKNEIDNAVNVARRSQAIGNFWNVLLTVGQAIFGAFAGGNSNATQQAIYQQQLEQERQRAQQQQMMTIGIAAGAVLLILLLKKK